MSGYINIAIKEKFDGSRSSRSHLTNKGKHIMRQHNEDTLKNKAHKSIDRDRTHLNETLISYQKPGETLNQTADRFIKEQGIEEPKRATSIRAVSGIISIPSEYLEDPNKLKLFQDKAKEFLETNEKLKGNVILAQTNFDETQPHIEFVFIPRDNENPKKLDYTKLFGSDRRKGIDGSKSLEKLHDEVALKVGKPLGLERGDGTNTKGLTNAEYLKSISDFKNAEKSLIDKNIIEEPKPLEKPEDKFYNRGKIIEIQNQEIKELRAYIKQTRKDRDLLKTSKGILQQNRKVRSLARDLKTERDELKKQNLEVFSKNELKPSKANKLELAEYLEDKKKKQEELDKLNADKEARRLEAKKQRELVEAMELRRLNQKRLDLENEKPKNNNSPLNKLKPKYGNDKDKN